MNEILTKEKLKGPPFANPLPHIVILGAGASKAAFCGGDRNRKPIPLMNGLPDVLGRPWRDLVNDSNPLDEGFEAQFSWIHSQTAYSNDLLQIEKLIVEYFEALELPDHPTIYDYIVLGLRPKDVVATFNWDPLLFLAHKRNKSVAGLPDIRFLHGCVGFATCPDHYVLGCPSERCPECRKPLTRSKLFFPEKNKDYTTDALVYRDWEVVTEKLKRAFHLTIFGYSGPKTDYKARQLLHDGWTQTPMQNFSHVEIIDIRSEDELTRCWKEFIPFSHYMLIPDFWCSTIAKWPRRTAEYKLSASLEGTVADVLGPFHTKSLHELQDWYSDLAMEEGQDDHQDNA
ncbi:MAG: hypothetical protein AABZ17_10970 [Nitrospirota bacterium]